MVQQTTHCHLPGMVHVRQKHHATPVFTVPHCLIQDTTDPTIRCPMDLTQSNDQPTFSPTVDDNIDDNPDVNCNPASGSSFAVGQSTEVTCTVTDNVDNSASCMFDITIGMSVNRNCPLKNEHELLKISG